MINEVLCCVILLAFGSKDFHIFLDTVRIVSIVLHVHSSDELCEFRTYVTTFIYRSSKGERQKREVVPVLFFKLSRVCSVSEAEIRKRQFNECLLYFVFRSYRFESLLS